MRLGPYRDVFVFNSAPNKFANVDRIVDFNRPTDTLLLNNAFLTKVGSNGARKADAFYLGKTAHDASDRIIYDKATGNLFYDADGQGGAAQIRIAVLLNMASSASSYLVNATSAILG